MSGDLSPCYYSLSGPQFAWFSAFLPYSHFLNSNRPACAASGSVAFSLHVNLLVADCQRTGRPCPAIRLCYPLSGPQFSWFSAFLPSSLLSQHFIGCIVQEVFGSRHLFALCFKRDSASSSHSLICLTRIVWTLLLKIEPDCTLSAVCLLSFALLGIARHVDFNAPRPRGRRSEESCFGLSLAHHSHATQVHRLFRRVFRCFCNTQAFVVAQWRTSKLSSNRSRAASSITWPCCHRLVFRL